MVKHVDVGEKIGGARKDFYARSLKVSDYKAMNEEERKVLVVKKNIFPPVDYKRWRENEISPHVGMFVKLFRQMLPDETPSRFIKECGSADEGKCQWIDALNCLDHKLTGRGSEEELPPKTLAALMPVLKELGSAWLRYRIGEQQTKEQKAIGLALQTGFNVKPRSIVPQIIAAAAMSDVDRYIKLSSPSYLFREVALCSETERDAKLLKDIHDRLAFKIGKGEAFFFAPSTESQQKNAMWDKVSKVRKVSQETKDKIKETKARQEIWHRPHLERVVVEGQRRDIHRHVTADELMQEFGFRAVEFGNWLPNDERQDVIDFAYDSFDQLAEALEVPRKAIGLNGQLAIAFGSRGHGGQNAALAHYEPLRKVINLTRLKGAGCLAHEWFHAFDHSKQWASEKDEQVWGPMRNKTLETEAIVQNSMNDLSQNILEILNLPEWSHGREKEAFVKDCLSFTVKQCHEVRDAMLKEGKLEEIFQKYARPGEATASAIHMRLRWSSWGTNKIKELDRKFSTRYSQAEEQASKEGVNLSYRLRTIATSILETSFYFAAQAEKRELVLDDKTQFLRDAEKLDEMRSGDEYWATNKEMFARAGASYVHDKLQAKNLRNDYLEYGAQEGRNVGQGDEGFISPNPRGEDRIVINAMFDSQISKWREEVKDLTCEPVVKVSTQAEVKKDQTTQVLSVNPISPELFETSIGELSEMRRMSQSSDIGEFGLMKSPLILSVTPSVRDDKYLVQTFDDSSMEQGGIVEYMLLPKMDFKSAIKDGRLVVDGERISAVAYETSGKEVRVKKEDEAFKHCRDKYDFERLIDAASKNDAVVWMDLNHQAEIKDILEENRWKITSAISRNIRLKEQLRHSGKGRGR